MVYLRQLYLALAAQAYARPIIIEGLRRLIVSEDWMPSIAAACKSCAAVRFEVLKAITALERKMATAERDQQIAVAKADKAVRALMDDETFRAVEMAEYRVAMLERRRDTIARLREEVAAHAKDLAPIEARLRRQYEGTPHLATHRALFDKWQAENQRQLEVKREETRSANAISPSLRPVFHRKRNPAKSTAKPC